MRTSFIGLVIGETRKIDEGEDVSGDLLRLPRKKEVDGFDKQAGTQ